MQWNSKISRNCRKFPGKLGNLNRFQGFFQVKRKSRTFPGFPGIPGHPVFLFLLFPEKPKLYAFFSFQCFSISGYANSKKKTWIWKFLKKVLVLHGQGKAKTNISWDSRLCLFYFPSKKSSFYTSTSSDQKQNSPSNATLSIFEICGGPNYTSWKSRRYCVFKCK